MSQQLGIYISTREEFFWTISILLIISNTAYYYDTHAPNMYQESNHEVNYVTVSSRFENAWAILI